MTRKDFKAIAAVLHKVEHRLATDAVAEVLERAFPLTFNRSKFMKAVVGDEKL